MVGAEVLVERGDVEVGEGTREREPVDVGGRQPRVGDRPLTGLGRDLAAVRPDAFVYAVSPIPAIATWPDTSSSAVAWPQS